MVDWNIVSNIVVYYLSFVWSIYWTFFFDWFLNQLEYWVAKIATSDYILIMLIIPSDHSLITIEKSDVGINYIYTS